MNTHRTIYYEFWQMMNGEDNILVSTGTRTVGPNSITTGVDTIPTAELTVPLEDLPTNFVDKNRAPNLALYKVKIFYQVGGIAKYVFVGTVDTLSVDYASATATMNLSHNVARMREWVMPSGYTVKATSLEHVLGPSGADLGYSSTMGTDTQTYDERITFDYRDGTGNTPMEMSFSSTDKLSALNEALNNTEDVHFVVDLTMPEGDKILIGKFGDSTDILVSPTAYYQDECDGRGMSKYMTMLTEPVYNVDYTNHFNRAVVFCGDVAESVMHLTLKEVYEDPSIQDPNFPVGMYDLEMNLQPEAEWKQDSSSEKTYNTTKINNEKIYNAYDVVAYANNTNREYYVTDKQQLEEDLVIKHTVFNFSDLYPIPDLEESEDDPETGETTTIEYAITDEDRKEITKRAYWRAIRKLKAQRPEHIWQFNSTPLPYNFQDGQKINFFYTKKIQSDAKECVGEREEKTIATVQDELFVTKRTITFDDELNEINTITLDRELRYRDISAVELQLRQLAQEGSSDTTAVKNTGVGTSFSLDPNTSPRDTDTFTWKLTPYSSPRNV